MKHYCVENLQQQHYMQGGKSKFYTLKIYILKLNFFLILALMKDVNRASWLKLQFVPGNS